MTPEERKRLDEQVRAAGVELPPAPPREGDSPGSRNPRRHSLDAINARLDEAIRQKEEEMRERAAAPPPKVQPESEASKYEEHGARGMEISDEIRRGRLGSQGPEAPEPSEPDLGLAPGSGVVQKVAEYVPGVGFALKAAEKVTGRGVPGQPSTKREDVRIQQLQRGADSFTTTERAVAGRLATRYAGKMARDQHGTGLLALPQEQRDEIWDQARHRAQSEVAGIVGRSEQRGNMLVPVDEEKLHQDVMEGNTWLGWLTGQKAMELSAKALEPVSPEAAQVMREFKHGSDIAMAPFHAMAVPGTYKKGATASPSRESKFWWMTRVAPSTVAASIFMNPEIDLTADTVEEISERSSRAVMEGEDIVKHHRQIGEYLWDKNPTLGLMGAARALMPESVQKEMDDAQANVKFGLGILGTGAIIWFEPGPELLLAPGAAIGKRLAGSFDLAKAAIKPAATAIEEVKAALAAGEELAALAPKFRPGSVGRRLVEYTMSLTRAGVAEDALNQVAKMGDNLQDLKREMAAIGAKAAATSTEAAEASVHAGSVRGIVDGVSTLHDQRKLLSHAVLEAASGDAVLRALDPAQFMKVIESATAAKKALRTVEGQIAAARAGGEAAEGASALPRLLATRRALQAVLANGASHAPIRALASNLRAVEGAIAGARASAQKLGLTPKVIKTIFDKPPGEAVQLVAKLTAKAGKLDAKALKAARHLGLDKKLRSGMLQNLADMEASMGQFLRMSKAERKVQAFSPGQAAFNVARDGSKIDPAAFAKAATDKYGGLARGLISMVGSQTSLTPRAWSRLRDAEEAVHVAMEQGRLANIAPATNILNQAVQGGNLRAIPMTAEGFAVAALRMSSVIGRVFEPVLGIGKLPEFVQESIKRHAQRFSVHGIEADRIAKLGDRKVVADTLIDYLFTSKVIKAGEDAIAGNQDVMTHAGKFIEYARMLATASKADFLADRSVLAVARAWLPPGAAGNEEAARAAKMFYRYIIDGGDASGLMNFFSTQLRVPFHTFAATEDGGRAFSFVVQGVLLGSSKHDLAYDWYRATAGMGLSADAARAYDFMAEPSARALKALKGAQKDLKVMNRFRAFHGDAALRTTYDMAVSSAKGRGVIRLALDKNGGSLYIPRTAWEGVAGIVTRMEKQLEQFNTGPNTILSSVHKLGSIWKIAAVMGWLLPRARYFATTAVGDWSQMVTSVGPKAATRIMLANSPTFVPFIGRKLHSAASLYAKKNSMFSAMMNPHIADVMAGSEKGVIQTLDGPLTPQMFMREARADGALDAISSGDFQKVFAARVDQIPAFRKFREATGLSAQPSALVKAATGMFESMQHRLRTTLYLEARTGRLTGKPMGRQEARKLLAETLYDYRTGVGAIEMQYIGWASAFWVYRRNMWRQLGAALTEPLTMPATEYIGKALTAQTKAGRMVSGMREMGLASEALTFGDEDEYLLPDEQVEAFGKAFAPWWNDSLIHLGNRPVDPGGHRRTWLNEMTGKDSPMESLILNGVSWADQLYYLNLIAQTGAALRVAAAEAVGIQSNVTHIEAGEIASTWIEAFGDALLPGVKDATQAAMRGATGEEAKRGALGSPVPSAWQLAMERDHQDGTGMLADVLGAERGPDGRWMIPNEVNGFAKRILMEMPQFTDAVRTWQVFDNPSYDLGMQEWLAESLFRYMSPVQKYQLDPYKSHQQTVDSKTRQLKELEHVQRKREGL